MALTPVQFDAFVELIGEERPEVWRRLSLDPGLVPLAAAAADARLERRRSGKFRTILGFSILGGGVTLGYLLLLSSIDHSADCSYGESCGNDLGGSFITAMFIVLASTGVGLGIGIPGIISMARQSEVETAAVDRYQAGGLPPPPLPPPYYPYPAQSAIPLGMTFKVPLLSIAF